MRKRVAGITLIEVSIVLSLTLILMTILGTYLTKGQRFSLETDSYATVHNQASVVLRRVSDELFRSSHRYLHTDGSGVTMLSYGQVSGSDPDEPFIEFEPINGKILWKKWVGFFLDESGRIVRGQERLVSPDSELLVKPLPNVDTAYFRSLPADRLQPISRQVKKFEVINSSERTMTISLTTWAKTPVATMQESDKDVEITVTTEVNLLN